MDTYLEAEKSEFSLRIYDLYAHVFASSGFVLDPSKCRKLSIEEKRELVHELSKWPDSAPEKLQTWSRRDLLEILCAEIGKERKYTGLTKQKMIEYLFKIVSEKKAGEPIKSTTDPAPPNPQPLPKRQRKNDHPLRLPVVANAGNEAIATTRSCQNLACRATMNLEDAFCKRCSCCICHKYDDNKDPSLWLICSSEILSQGNSCQLSCHLECALKNERAGIVNTEKYPNLDGSYYCTHCGKVNDLLGSWKKQLMIAKDARRVDVLCYRISLSHRILRSTKKYQSLHEIVDSAMKKLEAEVGPINDLHSMARGIVNRLSVGAEVQRMCTLAIKSLDSLHSSAFRNYSHVQQASLASSSFIKIEVTSPTSVTLTLKFEDSSRLSQEMAGCNLWHRKAEMNQYPKEPILTVLEPVKSLSVTELTPGTDYMFKIVAFSNLCELGMWEVRVTTDVVSTDDPSGFTPEINAPKSGCQSPKTNSSGISNPSEGDESHNNGTTFTDLNKSPESCFHYFEKSEMHGSEKFSVHVDPDTVNQNTEFNSIVRRAKGVEAEATPGYSDSAVDDEMNSTVQTESHRDSIMSVENIQVSDLPKSDNISNVPNANVMAIVPFENPDQTLPVTPMRLENSKEVSGRGSKLKPSNTSLQNGPTIPETVPASSSKKRGREKFVEICTKDGTLEGSYEYCVKVIRWLECEGHIETNFRVKFLTWFSLRATPQERRIVTVYVDTLIDDPASLAGQLVDTFSETISCSKKPPQVPSGFLQKRRMRDTRRSSKSLKRLFSLTIGRRSRANDEGESTEIGEPKETLLDPPSPFKPAWRCFSYEEICKATDGFCKGYSFMLPEFFPDANCSSKSNLANFAENLVGRGGHAEVYRGATEDGREIAVKRLRRASTDEQREKDFLTELGTVGHACHPNVCGLLGCCIDRDLHLVFEFSSRGSVSSNLHDESSPVMAWKLRHAVALGTARGLHYLHKECPRRIIHRDIKAANILLTANFEPKISDFGLAKWLPSDCTHCSVTPIEGTFGCLAPEYFMHGIIDEKTDVFAFGVFLLELISGRKPVDGFHKSLLSWARPFLNEGKIEMLVDPRLGDNYDIGQLRRICFPASLCIRATATLRPSMTEVLEMLVGGEISQDRWKVPEEEEDEEFWGFDDLDDDDENELDTPSTSSTGSSGREFS
ncbi:hypothetical protein ZIOFF_067208 [Zingiber officinale]|uniref:Protein kinase domain-containing protein n=1 Tax=Zingiber officinale TaxID=94328 RepID=A0A8J5CF78_ZINOF|nr:hypothetical protein ZIOFF_067208 [Zingiber officinale]